MFTRKLNNQFIAVNIFSKHIILIRVTYGCCNWHRNFFSFITEFTLRLEMMRAFAISFIAYSFFSLRSSTFQTLPKPPRPITYRKLKWFLFISGQNKSPQVSQNLICLRYFSKNLKSETLAWRNLIVDRNQMPRFSWCKSSNRGRF